MAYISIHNVIKIEVDKYQLDSGTYVCKIYITSESKMGKIISNENIILFSDKKFNIKS